MLKNHSPRQPLCWPKPVNDNETEHASHLYKVDPLLQYLDDKMATVYEKHLALDESMVVWCGRLVLLPIY